MRIKQSPSYCSCLRSAVSVRVRLTTISSWWAEKGCRPASVSRALATIERLGGKTGLWDITIRTDTEAPRKKKLEFNAKNLGTIPDCSNCA